jgi:pimeloyl-ACP methyl ester carboxylesterase
MTGSERIIEANGVPLCVDTEGDPADPAILLIHGASASLLWWDRELCERLATGGRYVIRYDSRDTGRSISYPAGQPGYRLTDLADDAIGILDALGVDRAHLVGRSNGGATALVAGVDHPERVASLTFVGTTTGDPDLPPMEPEVSAAMGGQPDPADRAAVVAHVVELMRAYSGAATGDEAAGFDEDEVRRLAEWDVERTTDMAAALTNHFCFEFDGPRRGGFAELTAPVLVVHGDRDPAFPLPHGRAVQAAIPGADLLVLADTGHDLPRRRYPELVAALLRHTHP